MEQLTIGTLDQARELIKDSHTKAFTSFIELGFVFRQVQELKLYAEGGYESLQEFAKAEYGYSQSQVSRFMTLNIEYSKDGNTPELDEKWKDYGQSKLIEMLNLPDDIREEISPEMKRDEIREFRKDYEAAVEEEKVENFTNAFTDTEEKDLLSECIPGIIKQKKSQLDEIFDQVKNPGASEDIRMAITGGGYGFVKIGSKMVFIKEDYILIKTPSSAGETFTYEQFIQSLREQVLYTGLNAIDWYEKITGEKLEDKKPAEYVKNADSEDFKGENEKNEDKNPTKPEVENTPQALEGVENDSEEISETKTTVMVSDDGVIVEEVKPDEEQIASADETTTPADEATTSADEATTSNGTDETTTPAGVDKAAVHILDCTGNYHLEISHFEKQIFINVGAGTVSMSNEINYCPVCGKKL